jgi:DNA-binding GntR family transcriptional regulator
MDARERRRQRQRREIAAACEAGDDTRATALAREHLVDFPDDEEVLRYVLERPS